MRHPLFQALEARLGQDGSVALDELLGLAGDQTYGLGIVVLSATCFIPGVANGVALGTLWLGVQMALGRPHPWLPARVRRIQVHQGRFKQVLARIESFLDRLGVRVGPRRTLPPRLTGLLVVWTAFLLALPLVIPLSNLLPGVSLILVGMGLLEEWPLLGWLGLAGSLATTIYFSFFLKGALHMVTTGWWRFLDWVA